MAYPDVNDCKWTAIVQPDVNDCEWTAMVLPDINERIRYFFFSTLGSLS